MRFNTIFCLFGSGLLCRATLYTLYITNAEEYQSEDYV